jgi:glycosyltransferase involved in cell wall biosynthesis
MKNLHPHSLPGLRGDLREPLPAALGVGAGTALLISGTTEHPTRAISSLELRHAKRSFRPLVSSPVRGSRRRRWRWVALAAFEPVASVERQELFLVAELRGGRTEHCRLGEIELHPGTVHPASSVPPYATGGEPAIAIAMATWNPPLPLFEAQIESIRAQTHRNWVCVISDDASDPDALSQIERVVGGDERFAVHRHSEKLGFYGNFERALALVPAGAELVALADQDDRWHPGKLEVLAEHFGPDTALAYSDMRVVDQDGAVLSHTYWSRRPTNHTDLAKLFVANTITGAASVFRASLLDSILPFPPRTGEMFHDHWVALLALSKGDVRYCGEALMDYVQHEESLLGHEGANRGADLPPREPLKWLRLASEAARNSKTPNFYENEYLPSLVMARTLELRGGELARHSPAIRAFSSAKLGLQAVRVLAGGTVTRRSSANATATLGRERWFLASLAWQAFARARGRAFRG